jgi:branched-subunit amino acid aminotransferase/4-amino-4-deoxychorismate lyase
MTPQEGYAASEMMLMGTSLNVLPVVSCDGRQIGDGRPGPVANDLLRLLERDMRENQDLLTEVPWE